MSHYTRPQVVQDHYVSGSHLGTMLCHCTLPFPVPHNTRSQVVQAFLAGRMRGIGDALYHLELWGLHLQYAQQAVDELDYGVKSLKEDLRNNGVQRWIMPRIRCLAPMPIPPGSSSHLHPQPYPCSESTHTLNVCSCGVPLTKQQTLLVWRAPGQAACAADGHALPAGPGRQRATPHVGVSRIRPAAHG
eukprot:1141334-Pelagomonas_calceolata.AAC.7